MEIFMGRAQLQGTPWHYEQMKKTCQSNSVYCIYNKNICSCKFAKFYHKKCVGKGECDWFESKTGTPKTSNVKIYKGNLAQNNISNINNNKKGYNTMTSANNNIQKESKEDKFLRLSKGRIDKIEDAIDNLGKLSDKYAYSYTDEQIDKMFDYIENKLQKAKDQFKNKKSSGGFKW